MAKRKNVYVIPRHLFFIALLLFSRATAFSQTKEIDSIRLVLDNYKKEDTNRINILNAMCWSLFLIEDYKNVMPYANEALSLSEKTNFIKGKAAAYINISWVFMSQPNYSEALKNALFALGFYQRTGDKTGMAESYHLIGQIYSVMGNLPEAMKNFYAALKIRESAGDKKGIARSYHLIAGINSGQGNYAEGIKNYRASLKINEELDNKFGVALAYNGIGGIYLFQNNYQEALESFLKALRIYEELKLNWGIFNSNNNMATVYEEQGKTALVKGDKLKSKQLFAEALKNYSSSLKIAEESQKTDDLALSFLNLGSIHIKLEKLPDAKKYLEKSLRLYEDSGNKTMFAENYKCLSDLDSIQGNYIKAFEHYKMYILYRDSLNNGEGVRKTEQLKMQYDFDKKEDSLKQQHLVTGTKLQAQKKQRYFYWAGLSLLALLSFFVFLNFRNQKKINRLAKDAHAKEKAELELQSLRAQLNPHFMFNSLNAIQELILLEENEKSQSYLARFAKLLRMLLENADKPFIPLQREIDFLQLYLSLENLRIPDLEHSINIDPGIDTEQTMIPNMILQPYIENAIWHGLSHKQSDRKLQIRVTMTNGIVQYAIEDNGVGRKKSAELKSLYRKEHKSKGMELLSKRFKLLAKEYGSDIETTISDVMNKAEVAGTLVTIKAPAGISGRKENLFE